MSRPKGIELSETEAFDELYRTARDRLAVQITALTGDRSEATDLVQEAFMRAWVRWDKIGRYDDPEGWVRRVAYNLAVSRWRRATRTVLRAVVPDVTAHVPSDDSGVFEALGTLSASERRAIVLHHLAGLPVAAVASEMRAPEGTVKSWLARGRDKLAEALAQPPAAAPFGVSEGAIDG